MPSTQVIGLGTQLDSARFRSLIAESLKLPPTQVTATILGEHGDSMVPDLVRRAGRRAAPGEVSRLDPGLGRRPVRPDEGQRGRGHQAQGGAGFAVGVAIGEVIHAIALDRKRILPVASLVTGTYGMRDVCLSVPTVVGRRGVEAQLEIDLWPKEVSALRHSGQVLRGTIDQVLKRNPSAAAKAAGDAGGHGRGTAAGTDGQGVRVTMGGGRGGTRPRVTISGSDGGSTDLPGLSRGRWVR